MTRLAQMKDDRSYSAMIPASLWYRAVVLAGACALFINAGSDGHGLTNYVIGVIAGLLALRTVAIRVTVSSAGIRIVNPFRSYRINWESVEDVRYEERGLAWIGRGIGVKRHRVILKPKNGIEISIAASQSMNRNFFGHSVFGASRTRRCLERIRAAWESTSPVHKN
jgi:hypothetical protein